MSIPFIDLKAQYADLKEDIQKNIETVLEHGKFIMGPEVKQLESELATFANTKHAVSCSNGTDALIIALMAADIGAGDAVFTSPFTYIATVEAIRFVGATPIFVDIEKDTFNIDPVKLADAVDEISEKEELNCKCIMPVDLFGLPANYPAINSIASKYDMTVIGDSAQGFGGTIDGERVATMAAMSTTSFFPAKPLGGYGDGGAVFTQSDEMAKALDSIRVHGQGETKYDCVRLGMNARLDTLQAAILLPKLAVFGEEIKKRNVAASRYSEGLAQAVQVPVVPKGYQSVWAQYSIVAKSGDEREKIREALKAEGIPTAVYYIKPVHVQTAMADLGGKMGDCPVSEDIADRILSLPMHPYLQAQQIDTTVEIIKKAVA